MAFTPQIDQARTAKLDAIKILITGFSGGGKTTLGATMDNPLIVTLEEQGVVSIKTIAPEANVILIDGLDPEGKPLIDPRTGAALTKWDHLLMVWGWVKSQINGGTFPYGGLVFDSLQDGMAALMRKLLGPRQSGGTAEEVAEALSQQQWGILGNRTLDMIRFLKALPVDVAVITKAEEVMDGEELKVRPGALGRMAPEALPYNFNLVLYCYKAISQDGGRPDYLVLTDGHSKFITKGHPALRPIEGQNLADMIARLKGGAGAGLIKPAEGIEGAKPLPAEPGRKERPGAADARKAKEEKAARTRGPGKGATGKPPAPPAQPPGGSTGKGSGKGKGKGSTGKGKGSRGGGK